MSKQKIAVIAGAGPAGLTAALELLRHTDIHPIVFEATGVIGGISQTVDYKGNRIDIGGHRFFSKNQRVTDFWQSIMPTTADPALDAQLLTSGKADAASTLNSPATRRVMLTRNRVSRIYYLRKFFDYPISLKLQTFTNMGLWNTIKAGCGYLKATIAKRPENSLEDFYINRFGKPLYEMFFEGYTEKVWDIHPSKLGADWGSQRVKGLSVLAILKDMMKKALGIKDKGKVETSLIESFIYPKYGPGSLWEAVADDVKAAGGEVRMQTAVKGVHVQDGRVDYVTVEDADGKTQQVACDYFLSTMPLKDLVAAITGEEPSKEVKDIAAGLVYRDFITVGLLTRKLCIVNRTKLQTYKNRVPDTWIYIQERDVKIGRLQVFNNWSPYMVKDYEHTEWIGLEYFCNEGDAMWQMKKEDFIQMAIGELAKIDIIRPEDVIDSVQVKIKKAYPTYYGAYYQLDAVKSYLNTISNLYCMGRNGQHRYNNMDHSMLTAMETVDAIQSGSNDKQAIWAVNTEEEYHESK